MTAPNTPSIRELLIRTLRSLVPYEVIAVTDTTAALVVLAVQPIPLLITEYHLSDMRGDEPDRSKRRTWRHQARTLIAGSPPSRKQLGTSKAALPTGEHGLAAISVVGARAFLSAWDAAACICNLAVEPLWLAVKYRCHPLVERLLLW